MESLEQRIARLVEEEVEIRPYDPEWVRLFEQESAHLRSCLPAELIRRIEHFGSTAVPGLAAKPIVDMLVEVADLKRARKEIVPLLEAQGYDYFWRPTRGDDGLPFYAWFIKRYPYTGARTHHIHMVEGGEQFAVHWERLLFRDYLIAHPKVAKEYELLKLRLAAESPRNRATYTQAKTSFIERVMKDLKSALPVSVRHATAGDSVLLAELGIETFRDAFGAQNSADDMALYMAKSFSPVIQAAELSNPSVVFLVAELEGEPVGYVQLRNGPRPASVRASRPIEIARFYARRKWIGRGVGPALMESVRREARARGHDVIWLGVWERNQRAIAFYRKWGFVAVDSQPFMLGNDLQTDLVMVCALE